MKFSLTFLFTLFSILSFSQETKIKAYIDCRCDENYIKQETSFLEYVRDQDLADVEIFIRDERNPTGSRSFEIKIDGNNCLLYTSPSPRDRTRSRMPSSA